MSASIPDLWSDDISVDVLSPIAILRAQQRPLRQRTNGLLEVEIETTPSESGQVRHQFGLVAPAMNRARYRILYVSHNNDLVYPVVVEAECFIPDFAMTTPIGADALKPTRVNKLPENQRRAATDQEFIKLVEEVLRSSQVRSL